MQAKDCLKSKLSPVLVFLFLLLSDKDLVRLYLFESLCSNK